MVKLSDLTPEQLQEHYARIQKKRLKSYRGNGGFGQGAEGKKRASEAAKKSWESRRQRMAELEAAQAELNRLKENK